MRWRTRLALISLLGSIAPAAAAAPAGPAAAAQARIADADNREVMAYRLTLPKLKQLTQYYADLGKQMKADPAYQTFLKNSKELAALREKDELTDAEQERMDKLSAQAEEDSGDSTESSQLSLSALGAMLVADPRAAAALKRAGLTPRETATMLYAFMGAYGLAETMKMYNRKEIPEGANVENVKFCQVHSAELGAMIESWAPMEAQGLHIGAQRRE